MHAGTRINAVFPRPAGPGAMIEAHNLRKTFNRGRVVAVDNVSFTARDGEITGLLGPNGAGKTTTLRMLYTLLRPDAGDMSIDGINPQTQPLAIKQAMGVVPDSRGLYDRLTARENIRYYGRLHGLPRAVINARIDELVGVLDMHDFINRRTDGFSQGQRVKVAIARALIHDPRTIPLHEPTNGLAVMTTRAPSCSRHPPSGLVRCAPGRWGSFPDRCAGGAAAWFSPPTSCRRWPACAVAS